MQTLNLHNFSQIDMLSGYLPILARCQKGIQFYFKMTFFHHSGNGKCFERN
jgi:hypothetical protein